MFGQNNRNTSSTSTFRRRPPRNAPVLVFFYGGSWDRGSKDDYAFVGHALAAQGFVTVLPDYRLYPQVRFPDSCRTGPPPSRGCATTSPSSVATRAASSRRALGGAYNAVMLGFDPHYLEAVGVDPKVIRGVAGLSGPYDFLPLDTDTTIKVFRTSQGPAEYAAVKRRRAAFAAHLPRHG